MPLRSFKFLKNVINITLKQNDRDETDWNDPQDASS